MSHPCLQQGVCKCAAVGAGGREGERSKQGVHLGVCVSGAMGAVDAGLGDMVDAVFASSGSNSPLSSSSPNQDDDTSGGLFTGKYFRLAAVLRCGLHGFSVENELVSEISIFVATF